MLSGDPATRRGGGGGVRQWPLSRGALAIGHGHHVTSSRGCTSNVRLPEQVGSGRCGLVGGCVLGEANPPVAPVKRLGTTGVGSAGSGSQEQRSGVRSRAARQRRARRATRQTIAVPANRNDTTHLGCGNHTPIAASTQYTKSLVKSSSVSSGGILSASTSLGSRLKHTSRGVSEELLMGLMGASAILMYSARSLALPGRRVKGTTARVFDCSMAPLVEHGQRRALATDRQRVRTAIIGRATIPAAPA